MRARRLGIFLTMFVSLLLVRAACAHPMGNFSVNHYSKIDLEGERIIIRYFIDLAEIPTYQELQQGNIATTEANPGSEAVTRYVAACGTELGRSLILDIDGKPVALRLISSGVIFPQGAGGLPTMKMGFVYEAVYPSAVNRQHVTLHYSDNNYAGHTGWKEIIAIASAGSLVGSSVPARDRSGELSSYPTDLLTSPPQALDASITAVLQPLPKAATDEQAVSAPQRLSEQAPTSKNVKSPTSNHAKGEASATLQPSAADPASTSLKPMQQLPAASSTTVRPQANRQLTPRSRFTELITAQHLSVWFLFTAAIIAIGLGGLHALEPGHGKTIVAAYLVGSKGTARHAVMLATIVTVSHTVGVFALGAITLFASRYIVPEQLYPWLSAFSGITIAGLGIYMLLRRLTGTASEHSHTAGKGHTEWMFWRPAKLEGSDEIEEAGLSRSDSPIDAAQAQSVSLIQLLTLGITGGIIPCPAALIVLLSAFALHRIGLGFFLIVAFSIGLAGVLTGFGVLMVYARRSMTHLQIDGTLTRRWLPVISAAFITVLGLMLTVQALAAVHLDASLFSKEKLGPILFVTGLGLVLGMRHSTDADHVVAISTIVSKQRSIRNAALIGSVWGMGHTITVFTVGSLIILFGVEIPPRIGLSMEFSVAIMLILLGLLNLTGMMQKITTYFTPAIPARAKAPASPKLKGSKTRLEKLLDSSVGRLGLYQCLRPLVIGLVHGLAGSAAVALLVLSTIHDPVWASVYLIVFGVGTMIGMMCMTAVIAVPLTFAGDRFNKLSGFLGTASGMVSLCFGSLLVYQLGFLGGLFTSHPQWTPR